VEFADRLLPFDSDAARAFATIASARRKAGRPLNPIDGFIAAIARSRNAAVATRNADDFEHCGLQVINPWRD
jgi:predicted nucleic acid-binding protein